MTYRILSPDEIAEAESLAQNVGPSMPGPAQGARVAPRDPARRREEKIRAYKREKELRGTIAVSHSKLLSRTPSEGANRRSV